VICTNLIAVGAERDAWHVDNFILEDENHDSLLRGGQLRQHVVWRGRTVAKRSRA
jgi:hypothetical protein